MSNKVRIIGGDWRGRMLTFADAPGLRPTPDRVRETVFNWLQFDLPGSRCLDLFAGSGVFGFEAASRGAESVVLVENNRAQLVCLNDNVQRFGARQITVHAGDAQNYLTRVNQPFDLVFIDPPYAANLIPDVIELFLDQHCLNPGAKIYLESGKNPLPAAIPDHWQVLRSKKAGQVGYHLLQISKAG